MLKLRRSPPRFGPATLLFVAFAAFGFGPAAAADAARGGKLAKHWCVSCHIVSADQTRGSDVAPPFSTIGSRPDFSAERTARFLLVSHPRMPDVHLTRAEARDLAAYIGSLAR
jgi:mono/diheme cytochrome c family protein